MTLSTDVYVLDEIDAAEVFRRCQELLAEFDDAKRGPDRQRSGVSESWRGGGKLMANEPDQGLSAWLMLHYREGGPLTTAEQAAAHEDHCDAECSGQYHDQACWLSVDFDTAYSYHGPNAMGCGDLHAVLVAQLGEWLTRKGIRWTWRNEFTGEVHGNPESLINLVSGGFAASAWFRTTVVPAIAAGMFDEPGAR